MNSYNYKSNQSLLSTSNCQKKHFSMEYPVLEDESMLPKSHYMTYNQKKIEKLYIVS